MDPLLAAEGKTLSVRAATSIGARPETLDDRHVPLARWGKRSPNGHDALDIRTASAHPRSPLDADPPRRYDPRRARWRHQSCGSARSGALIWLQPTDNK